LPDGNGVVLELLDRFRLTRDRAEIIVPPQSATVLAFLALRDRPVHRSLVAGTLWGDLPERRALADLRSALYRIHAPTVRASGNMLELLPDVRLDLREAMALAREMARASDPPTRTEPIVELLGRELLPDSDGVWLEPARERYRSLRLRALVAVARRLTGAGRHAEAIEVAQVAVAIEPMSETAQAALICALVAEGNEALALRKHESFRRRLWRELRVHPVPFEQVCLVGADRPDEDGATRGHVAVTPWRRTGDASATRR
jgi:DNA-binding SARP family transcriptional activator